MPAIANSLLRLDGIAGGPPPPFERPNDQMDFFILELGLHDDVEGFCARATEALSAHADFLHQMRAVDVRVTLFVELAAELPVIRFEAIFLKMLSDVGISLECTQEDL